MYYFVVVGWRPFPNAVLLGDSGYGNSNWLLTPVVNRSQNDVTLRFLDSFLKTRQLVECALGVLKEKIPCLNHLRLRTPERCAKVILACIVLCNAENRMNHNYDGRDETLLSCIILVV